MRDAGGAFFPSAQTAKSSFHKHSLLCVGLERMVVHSLPSGNMQTRISRFVNTKKNCNTLDKPGEIATEKNQITAMLATVNSPILEIKDGFFGEG